MSAPASASGGAESFPRESFSALAEIEPGSFWFRARNRLITWALNRYHPHASDLFELGCGTGFVLSALHQARPGMRVTGGEIYPEAIEIAASRTPGATFTQLDRGPLPFAESEFDLVCAFDVLEHIDDDEAVLAELRRVVVARGGLLITVPQHPRLWSAFDEIAMHRRRYRRSELVAKLRRAGFEPLRTTSFTALLLPLLALARLRNRSPRPDWDPLDALRPPAPMNLALERVLGFERRLISAGISFPAGGSLLVAARAV